MSTPIFVHLSDNLSEMYHFCWCDPSNFQNSISFVTKWNSWIIRKNTSHIKWCL